jgi:hypothetical protein
MGRKRATTAQEVISFVHVLQNGLGVGGGGSDFQSVGLSTQNIFFFWRVAAR